QRDRSVAIAPRTAVGHSTDSRNRFAFRGGGRPLYPGRGGGLYFKGQPAAAAVGPGKHAQEEEGGTGSIGHGDSAAAQRGTIPAHHGEHAGFGLPAGPRIFAA